MKFTPPFYLGGYVCADLCNSYDRLHTPPRWDHFNDYASVVEWGKAAGIVPKHSASPRPASRRSIAELIKTRALICSLLLPISRGEAPAPADIVAFNIRLQKISSKLRLESAKGRFVLINPADDPVERIIIEAVRSVADLLVSNQLDRMCRCEECGWLFYDSSRNHLRRWCSMEICGNRAKARRHYEKVKRGKRRTVRAAAGRPAVV
jgi:predicted RNA-binding Zn ribbon-like protein